MDVKVHYLSPDSLTALQLECKLLKNQTIPDISARIDAARQQGDLSENAEYHQAREDMSWAQGRLYEVEQILDNAQIIATNGKTNVVIVGSCVILKVNAAEKEYTIVGKQEADPLHGKISNESPLGEALLDHKVGDKVEVTTPGGKQSYEILQIK